MYEIDSGETLVAIMEELDPKLREHVRKSWSTIGCPATLKDFWGVTRTLIMRGDPVAMSACRLIQYLGPKSESFFLPMLYLLKEADTLQQEYILQSLRYISIEEKTVAEGVSLIIERLKDSKDYRVNYQGFWLLKRIYNICPQTIDQLPSDSLHLNLEMLNDIEDSLENHRKWAALGSKYTDDINSETFWAFAKKFTKIID